MRFVDVGRFAHYVYFLHFADRRGNLPEIPQPAAPSVARSFSVLAATRRILNGSLKTETRELVCTYTR